MSWGHPPTSTRRELWWMLVDGEGSAPSGYLQRKLEPTDVVLSSSLHEKLVFLFLDQNFVQNNKWTFWAEMN